MSERLPTVSPPEEPATEVSPPALPPAAPSRKLIGTLAVAGALAGLLIVLVFQWAQPRILAYQALVLQAAIQDVLSGPARHETLFLIDGALTNQLPEGMDSLTLERVYRGYDESGQPMGYAIAGGQPGFQDVIRVLFGYEPESERVLGMKVLESKETPGLGDKIEKDSSFVGGFRGVVAPLVGVKTGAGTGDEHEVDMITGATISSRAVIAIINDEVQRWDRVLGEVPAAEAPTVSQESATDGGPGATGNPAMGTAGATAGSPGRAGESVSTPNEATGQAGRPDSVGGHPRPRGVGAASDHRPGGGA